MKSYRPARIAEVIREVAAETILFKMQYPRIRGVTVTRVEVPSDLQSAKIYVSVMGSDSDVEQCLYGLNGSAGYVQRHLADRLKLRYTPALSFHVDKGLKNSQSVNKLLLDEGFTASRETSEEGSELPQAGDEPTAEGVTKSREQEACPPP
jgi:ribosome-binding factor A